MTQRPAPIEMQPATANRPRSLQSGVIQPNGATTRPKTSVPQNCADVSTMSGVPRSDLVMIINAANEALPVSAIRAGQLTACVVGRSAIITPTKPTTMALQRRQPTCSPRKIAEAAVTKIGAAR